MKPPRLTDRCRREVWIVNFELDQSSGGGGLTRQQVVRDPVPRQHDDRGQQSQPNDPDQRSKQLCKPSAVELQATPLQSGQTRRECQDQNCRQTFGACRGDQTTRDPQHGTSQRALFPGVDRGVLANVLVGEIGAAPKRQEQSHFHPAKERPAQHTDR